jgi:hypothetical protein
MGRRREVYIRRPDLLERVDSSPHHAWQGFDAFELAKICFRKRLADSIPKTIRIDRPKKTASQSRRHLAHRKDLNTVRTGTSGAAPGHMPGESRMHHDRAPRVFHI